tara:strand:- start:502 stop:906 length:405 start_codon:yes stop_codon:yes gene_type:complete
MKYFFRLFIVLLMGIFFNACDEILDGGEFHQLNGTWDLIEANNGQGITLSPPAISGNIEFSQTYEESFVMSLSIVALGSNISYTADWTGNDYTFTVNHGTSGSETYSYSLDEDDTRLTISNLLDADYDWIFNKQ